MIANLTLHYFEWHKTKEIMEELRRILIKGGLLICSVNSVQDTNYGAVGFPRVEMGLYRVNGRNSYSADIRFDLF